MKAVDWFMTVAACAFVAAIVTYALALFVDAAVAFWNAASLVLA